MVILERQLFTEVFPIDVAALPQLYAYRLEVTDSMAHRVGGKLAYRLRQYFPGHWVWFGDRLITDAQPETEALAEVVAALRQQQPKVFGKLAGVEPDYLWEPAAEEIAAFVARGPLAAMNDEMREALARTAFSVRNARVEREHRVRTWVVDNQPAVSFSVVSHLIYNVDVATYAQSLEKPTDLIGILVTDKNSTMQGQIIKVVGPLSQHRERLLGLTQKAATRALLQSAPDDELVLRVASGQNEYDYVASALQVLVGLADIERFGLDANHAARALRLKPGLRAQMVKAVADLAKNSGLIANAYSTQNMPEPFDVMPHDADIVFGNNRVRRYNVESLGQDFETNGAYWTRDRFAKEPVRIAVINSLSEPVDDFLEALRRLVHADFGFDIEIVRERKVRVVSQVNLESAVRALQKEPVDLLLVFVGNGQEDDDGDDAYDTFVKAQTVGRGVACLVVHESTLHKPEAMNNIVMGIFARAGNVPYLFDEALPYTDYVVGLDLIPQHKKDGARMTGVARVYRADGALVRYVIATDALRQDEVVPVTLLETLLPPDVFSGSWVVFHVDGPLGPGERQVLDAWAEAIGAQFFYVEIMRRGVPRVYALEAGRIGRPPRGTVFRLNHEEAFLITSSSGEDATPQPLHIRTTGLSIEDALHSVMMFTLLHYGALKTPKLPVTIHHAEYMRSSLSRGVLPSDAAGDVPFWL